MKGMNYIALTLVIVGAINWGLIGFFGFDLVTTLFGGSLFWVSRVIFGLVGIAGIYALMFYGNIAKDNDRVFTKHNHVE